MKPVIIYTTTGSREEAQTIGNYLVQNKLAACVNIIPNIESIYEWENKLHQDSEFLLMVKTDAKYKNEIQQALDHHHSYDLPEMIMVDIAYGNPKYLEWMNNNLKMAIDE